MTTGLRPAVLCAGRVYCDLIFTDVPRLPTMGTEVYAGGLGLHAGGGAPITAAHLAALGHPALLATHLPSAPFHQPVEAELARAGVDLALCQAAAAGSDPQVTVAITGGTDRAFLSRRTGPAVPRIGAGELQQRRVRHLHIGELATLVEQPELTALARAAGCTVSLDCSWDETLTAAEVESALGGVDVFLPNEAERDHLRALGLREPFAPLTAIKRGAMGASLSTPTQDLHAPAHSVPVVDTTGAGDAFNAGFLSAWLHKASLADCLAAGNAAAARSVSGRGGVFRGAADQAVPARPGAEV